MDIDSIPRLGHGGLTLRTGCEAFIAGDSQQMSRILSSYISLNRNFTTSRAMSRTYADAIAALNTLQSNAAVVEHIKKTGRVKYDQAIPEMAAWCKRIGYSVCIM